MATTSLRTLITLPVNATKGSLIDIRVLAQHSMETGYRRDSDGAILKRDLIRRFIVRFQSAKAGAAEGEVVFAATLHAAVSANPYFSFAWRASESGTFVFAWEGDNGLSHRESRTLAVGG